MAKPPIDELIAMCEADGEDITAVCLGGPPTDVTEYRGYPVRPGYRPAVFIRPKVKEGKR